MRRNSSLNMLVRQSISTGGRGGSGGSAYWARLDRKIRGSETQGMAKPGKCAQCGKPFKPKKVGTSGKPSRYCSASCLVAGLKPKTKPTETSEERRRAVIELIRLVADHM